VWNNLAYLFKGVTKQFYDYDHIIQFFVCVNIIRQKHETTELVFACRRPRKSVLLEFFL